MPNKKLSSLSDAPFLKMDGAGNDFIVTDAARPEAASEAVLADWIRSVCDRRRGVGADGVLFLSEPTPESESVMAFYNCDGSRAEMCGNGLRCAAEFARLKHWSKPDKPFPFQTDAGRLETLVLAPEQIRIQIPISTAFRPVQPPLSGLSAPLWSGTAGVPHAVCLLDAAPFPDLSSEGPWIRFHPFFSPEGTNVDFLRRAQASDSDADFLLRTWERGVEGETLACGTGVASACAVLAARDGRQGRLRFRVASGDVLTAELAHDAASVFLSGPARMVFSGRFHHGG